MDLEETQLDTELVYNGSFIKVRKDHARLPDGQVHAREYIVHPGAVAVLALQENGNLVMERQFRYGENSSNCPPARSIRARTS